MVIQDVMIIPAGMELVDKKKYKFGDSYEVYKCNNDDFLEWLSQYESVGTPTDLEEGKVYRTEDLVKGIEDGKLEMKKIKISKGNDYYPLKALSVEFKGELVPMYE